MFALQDQLAGLWTLVWHQGVGIALIVGFLAAAYFSPVFKKDFFYAALVVGAFMLAEDIGIHDEKKHVVAQEQLIEKMVVTAVQKSVTPIVRHAKDPWDRKEY